MDYRYNTDIKNTNNWYENYVRQQFKKLVDTDYGFSIKIFDAEGNSTNQMELTPHKAQLISKILKEIIIK